MALKDNMFMAYVHMIENQYPLDEVNYDDEQFRKAAELANGGEILIRNHDEIQNDLDSGMLKKKIADKYRISQGFFIKAIADGMFDDKVGRKRYIKNKNIERTERRRKEKKSK